MKILAKSQGNDDQILIDSLRAGKIGILPTDTIYGLVGSALNQDTVARIYRIKQRDLNKPLIILIGKIGDLSIFDIRFDDSLRRRLEKYWPGPNSLIIKCPTRKWQYLRRGGRTLAFRLPDYAWLQSIINEVGPIVAPSANLEGHPTVKTAQDAIRTFSEEIEFVVDGGSLTGQPSRLVDLTGDLEVVIRESK